MRQVCILGAGGQLGQELQRRCPAGVSLHAIDRVAADLTQPAQIRAVLERLQPDIIINAAAYTAVDRAESEPELAHAVNAGAPRVLAEWAQGHAARLLQVSTDFVFDGSQGRPYTPADPIAPLGVYGASKAAGEENIRNTLGETALILRTAWVYSQFGNNFVKTMLRLMAERESLSVVGDQIGTPTWAGGLAAALWRAVEQPEFTGTQHWTDAGVASWYDFAVAIQEEGLQHGLLARQIPIQMIPATAYPTPAQRPACAVLDKTGSYAALGAAPHWRVQLRQMMSEWQEGIHNG
ncbi:dTDP-4-dehydrorhamnose reductase [Acidithiobacillus sp. IBUN Pt1247-S3]|uniref:dTDP-4-dehydrorhamnose reductase n=1 Tax=Acidithiobacillus sp. IBUN Pt1247-S3 TaxID=3166642 RepID=UPI0034E53194